MEALRKLVALLATIALLLLSLLSGLISATSADDTVKNEVVSSDMEEAASSSEGVESEEVVLETDGKEEALGPQGEKNQEKGEDVGEGDELGEGAMPENPAGLGEEAGTDEEENPSAAEGGDSEKMNDGGAGMESGQDASPSASDDSQPGTAVSPQPAPTKSIDGDSTGSDAQAPEA